MLRFLEALIMGHQLYGNAGYLIGVLDACLVNGYGVQAISTLTHDNNIVTAVTSVAHGISQYSRQTISGANESGYNGEFVVNIIDAYSFYYTTSGISVSPATGTLSTKSESAGWTKPFSGTNLAAYRPGAGPRHFLRIDDTVTMASRCIGYENMTAVSTGTGPFPTSTQVTGGLSPAVSLFTPYSSITGRFIYESFTYTPPTNYAPYGKV